MNRALKGGEFSGDGGNGTVGEDRKYRLILGWSLICIKGRNERQAEGHQIPVGGP